MDNAGILAAALRTAVGNQAPLEIVDLGAGDGHLLVRVARQLAPRWTGVKVQLLDRVPVVAASTIDEFAALGWHAAPTTGDVLDWFRQRPSTVEAVVANLFIHHFAEVELRKLFAEIANCAKLFVAVEPRRAHLPLVASSLLWAIGCNAVTRHDAKKSVRAGFTGNELSSVWPAPSAWDLTERPAGMFSHLFVARRRE
jgi:hypothetical protein